MACQHCKKKCGVPIHCLYCDGHFCPRCTHLERHGCRGIEIKKEKDLKELQKRTTFDREPKVAKI